MYWVQYPLELLCHLRVDFVRCGYCGYEGELWLEGWIFDVVTSHAEARHLLDKIGRYLTADQCFALYCQIEAACWFADYQPLSWPEPNLDCPTELVVLRIETPAGRLTVVSRELNMRHSATTP